MRFRATFTERGLKCLEKGFLPTLEKFGKSCHMLLSPEEVFFIQTAVNSEGAHLTAKINVVRCSGAKEQVLLPPPPLTACTPVPYSPLTHAAGRAF